jgi:uncharacterized protein (TIGR02996 family)
MPDRSSEDLLFGEILRKPDDVLLLEIYADWLEEHGDERAFYLRNQVEFRRLPTPSLRRTLIEEYPYRHLPWASQLEQCGAIVANLTDFEFAWWGTGIGPVREAVGTYERFRYEDQPPLPVQLFDGTFDWLKNSDPEGSYNFGGRWAQCCEEIRSRGFFLPREFERFMTDNDLPARIKSCTDNEFTEPSPEEQLETADGLFVTFYADSQYCVIWGMLLPRAPGRYAPVLSGPPEDLLPEYSASELSDDESAFPGKPVLAASHLESFLYRWWIENEIWFATLWDETKRALTPVEQAYVDLLGQTPS